MLTQAELSGLSSVEFSVGVKWIHRACVPRRGRVSLGVDVGLRGPNHSYSARSISRPLEDLPSGPLLNLVNNIKTVIN